MRIVCEGLIFIPVFFFCDFAESDLCVYVCHVFAHVNLKYECKASVFVLTNVCRYYASLNIFSGRCLFQTLIYMTNNML